MFFFFGCVHTPLEWVAKSGAWTSKNYGLFSSQPNKDQSETGPEHKRGFVGKATENGSTKSWVGTRYSVLSPPNFCF